MKPCVRVLEQSQKILGARHLNNCLRAAARAAAAEEQQQQLHAAEAAASSQQQQRPVSHIHATLFNSRTQPQVVMRKAMSSATTAFTLQPQIKGCSQHISQLLYTTAHGKHCTRTVDAASISC
jgi:hypothetical protein